MSSELVGAQALTVLNPMKKDTGLRTSVEITLSLMDQNHRYDGAGLVRDFVTRDVRFQTEPEYLRATAQLLMSAADEAEMLAERVTLKPENSHD